MLAEDACAGKISCFLTASSTEDQEDQREQELSFPCCMRYKSCRTEKLLDLLPLVSHLVRADCGEARLDDAPRTADQCNRTRAAIRYPDVVRLTLLVLFKRPCDSHGPISRLTLLRDVVNACFSYIGYAAHLVQGSAACAHVEGSGFTRPKIPSLRRQRQQGLLSVGVYLS